MIPLIGLLALLLAPPPPLPPKTLTGSAPVSLVTCPDAPAFYGIVQSLPANLWPTGTRWTITECDEGAWPIACRPYASALPTGGREADGFVVYDTAPTGIHAIYIRRQAPDGVPPTRILWHELGHVVWPGLVDTDAHEFMAVAELLRFFGGGQYEFPLGRPSRTEEAFALAFEANRADRADRAHAGADWGQLYIDGLFSAPASNSEPVGPPYIGEPIGGPVPIMPGPISPTLPAE